MGNRTKNRVISIRVTQEVYDEIHSKADAAGEGLSAYLTDAAIGKEIIQQFVDNLLVHYGPRTCKRKIACIKAFFNYLEFEDIIPINPFRKIRLKIKEAQTLPKVMKHSETTEQLRYVYQMANNTKTKRQLFYAKRAIAVYELLLGTGMRIGELCHLKLSSLDLDNQTIRILGKGGKEKVTFRGQMP